MCRGRRGIAIARIQKSEDRFGQGCARCFHNTSVDFLMAYVRFELFENTVFHVERYVFRQLLGVLIGQPISAHCICIYAMACEMCDTGRALLGDNVSRFRYRDNIYLLGAASELKHRVEEYRNLFSSLYNI